MTKDPYNIIFKMAEEIACEDIFFNCEDEWWFWYEFYNELMAGYETTGG